MRELRQRFATAPLAVHAAVLTVWFGAATWALGRFLGDEPANLWMGHAVGAVPWGASRRCGWWLPLSPRWPWAAGWPRRGAGEVDGSSPAGRRR